MRVLRRWLTPSDGQSLIETALILPVFVFGLLGGVDLARAYAVQIAVENGSRAAAESYAIDSTPTSTEATNAAVAEMNRTPTVNATASNVTVTEAQFDGLTACMHPPNVATPCFVTIRVTYTFNTVTRWPLVPNVANFDRSTTFRLFY